MVARRVRLLLWTLSDGAARWALVGLRRGHRLLGWTPQTGWGWLALYGGTLLGPPGWADHPVEAAALVCLFGGAVWRWAPPEGAFLWATLGGAALVGWPQVWALGGPPTVGEWTRVDDLGRSMLALVGLVTPVVGFMGYHSVVHDRGVYWGGMLGIWAALVVAFSTDHLVVFYIAFEALAFPMFVQVGRFGSTGARRRAAFRFFVYPLLGSATAVPALLGGSALVGGFGWAAWAAHPWTPEEETVLAGCLALPFVVKLPVVPFHLWLVEAHVEAPAPSSMVLAGLLLKTGGYGYLRWVHGVFPGGAAWWSPLGLTLTVGGVALAGLFALVQTDLKRMLAYSSVAHMGVAGAGLFVGTPAGAAGGVYTMLAHGFCSAGLFGGVGALYDRYHTRTIRDLGGLAGGAPHLATLMFLLCLGNLGFPLTGGFVGEWATLGELVRVDLVVALPLGVGTFLGLVYTMWGYNRVFFGGVHPRATRVEDLYPAEWAALVVCTAWTGALGLAGGAYFERTALCYAALVGPLGGS